MLIAGLVSITAGLAASRLLFSRFPLLSSPAAVGDEPRLSIPLTVIIPARNEADNLPLLLADLQSQVQLPAEIICVDDASTDQTAAIARRFGAKVISLRDKPPDWIGKSWACQQGAEQASGELLLFLDADVRLAPDAILRLLRVYLQYACTISVQPYHQMQRHYEQYSCLFNLVQVAANGLGLPRPQHTGLSGPVILISRADYEAIGGHAAIHTSIVDDISLGQVLKKQRLPFRVFLGGDAISFRMYGHGFRQLLDGWTKNFAAGAAHTPWLTLVMVGLFVTGCTAAPLYWLAALLTGHWRDSLVFAGLYGVWVCEMWRIARPIGNFRLKTIALYPISLSLFLAIFLRSLLKRLFHRKVRWKDRLITP